MGAVPDCRTLSEMIVLQIDPGNWKSCVYVLFGVQRLLEFAWSFRDREHGLHYTKSDAKWILLVQLIQGVLSAEYHGG